MTTMLEKMALAIAAKMQDAPVDMATFSWGDVNGWTRDMSFDCARAALQAIREPDEVRHLLGQLRGNGNLDWEADDGQTWTVLIDAILSEGEA